MAEQGTSPQEQAILLKSLLDEVFGTYTEPTEPSIRQIEVDFLTQPPFGADAEAIAHDQHPDHKLRIDRGPARRTIESGQLPPELSELDEPVD